MHWPLSFLFSVIPLSGVAITLGSRQCQEPVQAASQTFNLVDHYQGNSFLSSDWDYFTGSDPTNGNVNYLSREEAQKENLAFVTNGVATLAVDSTSVVPPGGSRNSVRISTVATYSSGLFIADFQAMPYGCTLWPAYWSFGPGWPNGGEIDVIEGANNQRTNTYTLHTGPGCSMPPAPNSSGRGNITCASSPTNHGCSYPDNNPESYGAGFNNGRGGVYAHLWTNNGITIWHFFRDSIPSDITAKQPNPSTWGPPAAFFPSTDCNIPSHFYQHSLVLDITICGDLGDATYASTGCPGTCAEAVSNLANFRNAKWEINYIAVYQS